MQLSSEAIGTRTPSGADEDLESLAIAQLDLIPTCDVLQHCFQDHETEFEKIGFQD